MRYVDLWNDRGGLHAVDATSHFFNGPDPAISDERDRQKEALVNLGSLHRANLEYAAGFFDNLLDELAFIDRQRERLFAIDILAGFHRLNRYLRVPMVRRSDHDRIDIFAIENLAIVAIRVRFLALALFHLGYVNPQNR